MGIDTKTTVETANTDEFERYLKGRIVRMVIERLFSVICQTLF